MSVSSFINWLSQRVFDHRTYRRRAVARWLAANRGLLSGWVLDVGSKKRAGRGLFALERRSTDHWVALDIGTDSAPDVVARGERLPFREGVFDAVVCSEVVEHVANPDLMIQEIHRTLRPGGCLLLSSPFLYPIHGDPHDYHRLTEARLRQLLSCFRDVHIEISGYFASVIGDVLKRALHGTSRRRLYKYLLYPLLPLIHLLVAIEHWSCFRRLYGWDGAISGYLIIS